MIGLREVVKKCDHPACVMPGKWRARLVCRPPVHYEPMEPGEVNTGVCVCEIHRREMSVDAMFSSEARVTLDRKFVRRGQPAPDWARCTLEFDALDPDPAVAPREGKA